MWLKRSAPSVIFLNVANVYYKIKFILFPKLMDTLYYTVHINHSTPFVTHEYKNKTKIPIRQPLRLLFIRTSNMIFNSIG